jgi:hypothetical protein
MQGKVATSTFYIQSVLPQAHAWAQAILNAGEVTGDFAVEQF